MTDDLKTDARQPRRKRRWAFLLVALAIGLIAGLLLLEVAFRLFWQLPPWFAEFQQAGMYVAAEDGDPKLQPGYRGKLQIGEDIEAEVAINSLGLRGPELAAKQPDERRVLVVGDSLVFGYGVEADQALPACLERELGKQGHVATFGNAGVPSYGSRHAVAHMARLAEPFGADAFVVCGFLGNDPVDETKPQRTVYAGMMLHGDMALLAKTSFRTRLALRSRAALWVEAWILTNKPSWSPLANVPPDTLALELAAGLPPALPVNKQMACLFLDARDENKTWQEGAKPVIPRLIGYLRDSLRRAKAVAGERPLVFVILPTSWHVDENKRVAKLKEFGFDPAEYERGLSQRRWLSVAKELDIPAFDVTPVLAAAGPTKELFVLDGGHLSVRGNQIVAEWLAPQLAVLFR